MKLLKSWKVRQRLNKIERDIELLAKSVENLMKAIEAQGTSVEYLREAQLKIIDSVNRNVKTIDAFTYQTKNLLEEAGLIEKERIN